jgi:hypothetical protein
VGSVLEITTTVHMLRVAATVQAIIKSTKTKEKVTEATKYAEGRLYELNKQVQLNCTCLFEY